MPDKFAQSEFEQLRWPNGQTSQMKFVIEPTGTYSRRVGVGKTVLLGQLNASFYPDFPKNL